MIPASDNLSVTHLDDKLKRIGHRTDHHPENLVRSCCSVLLRCYYYAKCGEGRFKHAIYIVSTRFQVRLRLGFTPIQPPRKSTA
jgi:hypothetical protein